MITNSWVINSNGQVRQRMDKMDKTPRFSNSNTSRHQQTYDFSKMYTTLKLESPPGDESKGSRGMKEMMKKYAALVFHWAKQNHSPRDKDKVLFKSCTITSPVLVGVTALVTIVFVSYSSRRYSINLDPNPLPVPPAVDNKT